MTKRSTKRAKRLGKTYGEHRMTRAQISAAIAKDRLESRGKTPPLSATAGVDELMDWLRWNNGGLIAWDDDPSEPKPDADDLWNEIADTAWDMTRNGSPRTAMSRNPRPSTTRAKSDREVLVAFLEHRSATGKKLRTDGRRLDGMWMGGSGIAKWSGTVIEFSDLGSRAAQSVERAIRKMMEGRDSTIAYWPAGHKRNAKKTSKGTANAHNAKLRLPVFGKMTMAKTPVGFVGRSVSDLAGTRTYEYGAGSRSRSHSLSDQDAKVGKNRKAKRNASKPASVDSHEAKELELYIDNDAALYQQWKSIVKNLQLKREKGTCSSSRAADGFMFLVDAGARKYRREFGMGTSGFNRPTRRKVAESYASSFESGGRDEASRNGSSSRRNGTVWTPAQKKIALKLAQDLRKSGFASSKKMFAAFETLGFRYNMETFVRISQYPEDWYAKTLKITIDHLENGTGSDVSQTLLRSLKSLPAAHRNAAVSALRNRSHGTGDVGPTKLSKTSRNLSRFTSSKSKAWD